MSNNEPIIKVINKDETDIDPFIEKAIDMATKFMEKNTLVQQIIEIEKRKQLSLQQLDNDVKFGTIHLLERIDELEGNFETGIHHIQNELRELNKKITPTKTIVMREITKDKAKKEIEGFINKNKNKKIFPSDISDELQISYDITLEVIQELIKNKKIEIVE